MKMVKRTQVTNEGVRSSVIRRQSKDINRTTPTNAQILDLFVLILKEMGYEQE